MIKELIRRCIRCGEIVSQRTQYKTVWCKKCRTELQEIRRAGYVKRMKKRTCQKGLC